MVWDQAEFVAKDGVDQSTGKAAVFTGRNLAAWHGLGTTIPGLATAEQARELSVTNWRVGLYPVYAQHPNANASGEDLGASVSWSECPRAFAVMREDTKAVLGVVGAYYKPLQNAEAMRPVESVVGDGAAVWDTAGALDGGRVVWAQAKLPFVVRTTPTDVSEQLFLVAHAHDGSKSVVMLLTSIRVVCQNTMRRALKGASAGVKVRHTGDVAGKTNTVGARYLNQLRAMTEKMETETQAMAKTKMRAAEFSGILEEWFPTRVVIEKDRTPAVEGAGLLDMMAEQHELKRTAAAVVAESLVARTEAVAKNNRKLVDLMVGNFERHNEEHGETANTAWAALNAVTEWVDHDKKYLNAEKRFENVVLGAGGDFKDKAYSRLLEAARS